MRIFILSLVLMLPLTSWPDDMECTKESREKWLKTDEMKTKAEVQGYRIKKFMTLEKCYQITGELDGKKVVHYFNPVTGELFPTPETASAPAAAPAPAVTPAPMKKK
jgi:hypothetical protein